MKYYYPLAVLDWYENAFSEENLGDRAIKREDIRFSMNDIYNNFDNIPSVNIEKIIDELISEIDAKSSNTSVKFEGLTLESDMGYALEGMKYFAKILKIRLWNETIKGFKTWEEQSEGEKNDQHK